MEQFHGEGWCTCHPGEQVGFLAQATEKTGIESRDQTCPEGPPAQYKTTDLTRIQKVHENQEMCLTDKQGHLFMCTTCIYALKYR